MAKWGEIKCPRCEEADDLVKRMNDARDFPANTCGASRHAAMIAEALCSGEDYPMLAEEPDHCGESIAATGAALWECRTKLAQQDDLVQAAVTAALRDAANTCVSCGAPTPNDFCKFCLEEE